MNYGYKRQINQTFEQTEQNLRQALTEEDFRVITEIDVKNIFKQKLNYDYKKYKILGVCEPNTVYKALSIAEISELTNHADQINQKLKSAVDKV